MKATHTVIENEGQYLKAGEKVYILTKPDPARDVWVQSVEPTCHDGRWYTSLSNLRPLKSTSLENK